MNTNHFEALCYFLWLMFIGYIKLDTIYCCINYITKNKKLSILCVFTYFIFLSQSQWNYLFKFSVPIAFWSFILKK